MLIQCTKKLLDQLKIKPQEVEEEAEPLFSWHANILTLDRRKTVVLVNDSNRYVIVLYGLVAKDFKKMDQLIPEAIKTVFQAEGIDEGVIYQFLEQSSTMTYTKTKNRTAVARMNKSIETVYIFTDLLDHQEKIQTSLSVRGSRFLVGHGDKGYIKGTYELYKDLEEFAGKPVIQTEAVQMKVTLNLEGLRIWRRLIVPLHFTFEQLHLVLQKAFNWQNYHLHEFYVYDNKIGVIKDNEWNMNHSAFNREGKKPILNIVSAEEAFNYRDDLPMKLDTEVKLSEFMPEFKLVRYNYDFGDDWRHDIEVEKYIKKHDKNYSICLDGEGTAPPEDVGGEGGYEQFLKVISDDTDPEHGHMVAWSKAQGFEEFNIVRLNASLRDFSH